VTDWVEALQPRAPDVVAAWNGIDASAFLSVRREVRKRSGVGTAERITEQLQATADALREIVEKLPDRAFLEPGGEADWNVAQTIGHAADSRGGLALAASLAASGRWPADAQPVVPGVPGASDASRGDLVRRIATSQRVVERSAARVAGHELEPCPLEHPLVGRLRSGEWLLFAGVHDLMHLEQLHALARRLRR
jgi:hypothetical protein